MRKSWEGIDVATLEQLLRRNRCCNSWAVYIYEELTNHKQRRRPPQRAMWLETQSRDVPSLPSSLCSITARRHSRMKWPRRCAFYTSGSGLQHIFHQPYHAAEISVSRKAKTASKLVRILVSCERVLGAFGVLRSAKACSAERVHVRTDKYVCVYIYIYREREIY